MANVFIEESTLTAIGNAIRAKTGGTEGILPSDMPAQIESIEAGSGGGENANFYDTFWDTFQSKGGGKNYYYAFSYSRFSDQNYNPKYDIVISEGTTPGRNMFQATTGLTSTKVAIFAPSTNIQQAFYGCTGLVTIPRLDVKATTTYSQAFYNCPALKNITITGTIGKAISFSDSPKLTHDSLMSIINALNTKTDGSTTTLTLHATAKARLSTEEIAIATQKGWSVV